VLNIMSHLKIHHLREAGLSQQVIATEVGCCVRTVYAVLHGRKPTAAEVTVGAMTRERPLGRPRSLSSHAETIRGWLAERPDLPGSEVVRRLHAVGYRGSARTVYRLVDQVRPAPLPATPEVRFEGLPGEFAQFDFGQVRLRYRDGSWGKTRFFVGTLKYSRFRHIEIVPDETAETLARAVASCCAAWGGAPKQWVFDNPSTVWSNRARGIVHPHLRQLLAEANALIEPCTVRRANQKGQVEGTVRFVKSGFFLARDFANPAEVACDLPGWLHYVNHERPCEATGVIPAQRLAEERERLGVRALPWDGDALPLQVTAQVLPTGLVRFNGSSYSVDPKRIGAPATLLVRRSTIDIEIGGLRCTHPRQDHAGAISRLPEHSLAQVAVTTEMRKQTYTKRQHLFDLGPATVTFCDHLITGVPGNSWYPDIHRLYDLCIRAGADRFLAAIADCLERRAYTVAAVASQLNRQAVAG
jgi:transposase